MSLKLLIPRGNPLTEVMELTTRDGVPWVAYVEGIPAVRRHRLLKQTMLPGRRLRFDSPTESRVSPELPAGSPFLTERRLLGLLAAAPLLPAVEAPLPAGPSWRRRVQVALASVRRGCIGVGRTLADGAHVALLAVEALLYGHRVRS